MPEVRTTHAWGAMSVGVAILLGTVPLARYASPRSEPWWQPGLLVVGAVLLFFGMWAFVTSNRKVPPPSLEDAAVATAGPRLAAVMDPLGSHTSYFDPDTEAGAPVLSLRIAMHVSNKHPTETAVLLAAGIHKPEFDGIADGATSWPGIVWQPSGGAAPIRIPPRDNVYVMCQFDGHPLRDADGWKRHSTVEGDVFLIDQFAEAQQVGHVCWRND